MEPEQTQRRTYLLVDGENIDATLGMSVLGHRPAPEERPRWERVTNYAQALWNQPITALFFLNASSGQMPMGFVQALLALGYHPIPLSGSSNEKVVDIGIQRMLEAISANGGDVLLASHDGDFLPQVEQLLEGDHRVGLLAFREFANARFTELTEDGLTIHDLEDDLGAFNTPLPRVRIIPIGAFDPMRYL
ncbi:NYN domain-containing protein [Serinibacter arcticus]|uniref:NYN domain-containing protein n=1 Tax=Serinibacter arcticus TaxID=1655435 RepID=A0A4Z1E5S3_9MICO|nr:NYN domain-containing protein [Serinibacter arcticus]TGO05783.1 hypothetical protein SERN_1787 [Serinibacter arcticus]